MAENLPEFRKPPVIETILGVQFDLLSPFSNAYLGAFWETLGPDWPFVEDAPAIGQEYERFGKDQLWTRLGALRFNIATAPPIRILARNRTRQRMIQLQNGRLHYNWLGHDGSEYVRYHAIRSEFTPIFERLGTFLESRGIGSLRPNQWEVTYVNHLPRGTVWQQPADWNKVFSTAVAMPSVLPESNIESFSGQWHYEIGQQRGRLHVELQHGREDETQGREPKELLIFKLTARGPAAEDQEGWDWSNGLELGHRTIVKAFKELTSDEARKAWEQAQ